VNIYRTERFKKDFKKLPNEIRSKLTETLNKYILNEHYPSLHVKKMEGTGDIWEMRVTVNYRITFHKLTDGVLLRRIGTHSILHTP
jgi:mRNA-degrading endonuclease RelE of RelBE toxin-antitoxin system